MAVSRTGLKLTDGSTEYDWPIAIDPSGKQLLSIEAKPWEPGDPSQEFRVALHPWDEGVGPNRIDYDISFNGTLVSRPSRKYSLSHMDCSYPGIMVPPPALNSIGGPADSTIQDRFIIFNGVVYFTAARAAASTASTLWKLNNSTYAATAVRDMTAGNTIYDMAAFNNELILAMGSSVKAWKMTTGEAFTQAGDNVFLTAIETVGETLWGWDSGTNVNALFSCTTTPLTLSSWTPANPNQYKVGDTSTSIREIINYGGVAVVVKEDGVYFPDQNSVYHNQTPQLANFGSKGITGNQRPFTAWGYLWVPSAVGLLRVTYGESVPFGPQLAGMQKFPMNILSGIEYGGDIYLMVEPYGTSDSTVSIIKMMREGDRVFYHQIHQIASSTLGKTIFLSPTFTNPSILVNYDSNFAYIIMGRGGGRNIDDANYSYNLTSSYQSGDFVPGPNLAIESYLEGVEVVCDCDSSESLTVSYEIDRAGSFTNMLTTQDGGGTAAITNTSGFSVNTRYATPGDKGQMFNIKITGSNDAGTGTDRFEIREIWAFGWSHPKVTDMFIIGLYADKRARVRGRPRGMKSGETLRLFRNWLENGTILTMELNDYEESRTIRVRVVGVKKDPITTTLKAGVDENNTDLVTVILRRTDFAPTYGD